MDIYIVIKRRSTYSSGIDETILKAFTNEESAQQFINKDCAKKSENMWFSIEKCELL